MTSSKRIGLAASLVLGMLSVAAVAAAPASASWWGDGQYRPDNRWNNNNNNNRNNNRNNDWNNRYNGYHYREPPAVYSTPYNYGYQPPPVIYDNTPGFTIRIQ